jgi:putative RNA 2'-phosphotransferase
MPDRLVALSRRASHALRHEPWLYDLEPDEQGWVPIEELARALDATAAEMHAMAAASAKDRYEVGDGHRIRARYGHSLPAKIEREPETPPAQLFHGTDPAVVAAILAGGLVPRGRQYVHLSIDVDTAHEVGARKAPRPAVLTIDAAAAHAEGVRFYRGNAKIWLADHVPPSFIR